MAKLHACHLPKRTALVCIIVYGITEEEGQR